MVGREEGGEVASSDGVGGWGAEGEYCGRRGLWDRSG